MISVLFTKRNSIYAQLKQDCWDKKRDARTWPGGNALIAHPPCRAWGKFHRWSKHDESEKQLAVFSIHKIRMWGGVLEHPRQSKLWEYMDLPKARSIDQWGGYSICIKQSWYGHRAEKETLLYIVGIKQLDLPDIPIKFDLITKTIEHMGRPEREATPPALAAWLIETANRIENLKNPIK